MSSTRPPCPFLPEALPGMDWRSLNRHRDNQGADFYEAALRYAQHLWQQGLSARALLAVDRALFAELCGDEAVLRDWPLPYRVVPWMLRENPEGVFIGNPRVHYQHLADRVRGERAGQKRWRAWACWALVRRESPELPGDPKHEVEEPTEQFITEMLVQHGIPGEAVIWKSLLL